MSKYLFIESRDPFESHDSQALYDLIQGHAEEGHEVAVFLIQNGVLPARKGSKYAERLAELTQSGVTVLADDFSLRERAIWLLVDGVSLSPVETLVDLALTKGTKTIWH
jgi:sulfur transfer complex TusBCD TusB component (DsrH family)